MWWRLRKRSGATRSHRKFFFHKLNENVRLRDRANIAQSAFRFFLPSPTHNAASQHMWNAQYLHYDYSNLRLGDSSWGFFFLNITLLVGNFEFDWPANRRLSGTTQGCPTISTPLTRPRQSRFHPPVPWRAATSTGNQRAKPDTLYRILDLH